MSGVCWADDLEPPQLNVYVAHVASMSESHAQGER